MPNIPTASIFFFFFLINNKILLKVKTHYTTVLGGRQNPTKRTEKVTFVTAKDPTQRAAKDPTQRATKQNRKRKRPTTKFTTETSQQQQTAQHT